MTWTRRRRVFKIHARRFIRRLWKRRRQHPLFASVTLPDKHFCTRYRRADRYGVHPRGVTSCFPGEPLCHVQRYLRGQEQEKDMPLFLSVLLKHPVAGLVECVVVFVLCPTLSRHYTNPYPLRAPVNALN